MRQTAVLVSVGLLVAAVATVPVGGLAAGVGGLPAQQTTAEAPANESVEVAPGERLSGVLNVGKAELENDVDSRAFGIAVAQAATAGARADVVDEQLGDIEGRIERLEERKQALDRARANESMSDGAYQARIAEVAARREGATQLANQSARAAGGLPAEVRKRQGINVTAIRRLQTSAETLGGPAVSEIARRIAGPSVGKAPGQAGPPTDTDPGNATTDTGTGSPQTDGPGNRRAGNASGGNATAGAGAGSGR
jgi:hypothetical protein